MRTPAKRVRRRRRIDVEALEYFMVCAAGVTGLIVGAVIDGTAAIETWRGAAIMMGAILAAQLVVVLGWWLGRRLHRRWRALR